jgi:hypothetical protein
VPQRGGAAPAAVRPGTDPPGDGIAGTSGDARADGPAAGAANGAVNGADVSGTAPGVPGGGDPSQRTTAASYRPGAEPAAPAAPAGVGAAQHAGPVGPAPAPVTATPSASGVPTAADPPARQVALHVLPLRVDGDGVHRLTVHLHPADLGQVSLVAEIRDGTISLQLAGATEVGREALRGALPDLRRELTESGFRECHLDLRQDGGQPGQPDRRPLGERTAPPGPAAVDPASAPAAQSPVRGAPGRRLDVHI